MAKGTVTSYEVVTADGSAGVRARKDAAIRLGEQLGVDFQVLTGSGTVVHVGAAATQPPAEAVEAAVAAEEAARVETFAGPDGQQVTVPEDEPTFTVTEQGQAKIDALLASREETDAPAPGAVEVRRGRKWVLYFVDGEKVGALSTDHFDALVEAIRVSEAS